MWGKKEKKRHVGCVATFDGKETEWVRKWGGGFHCVRNGVRD